MLSDRKRIVEQIAIARMRVADLTAEYAAFLRTLFAEGDWFVTLTFRDRHQDADSGLATAQLCKDQLKRPKNKSSKHRITQCATDPRIETWEPDSRYRADPGPPVRDAALREIEHWLIELGWEAAGHTRQELFNILAANLEGRDRRTFAKRICKRCMCCVFLERPTVAPFYNEIRLVATKTIGWVIAEEFGRVGGRWHAHLIVRGVQHIRRKKWWRKAFVRFGRNRIEPIHK